ncbi:MAG: 50S ribosomal protein L4 [Simkaniaceae bacterium]
MVQIKKYDLNGQETGVVEIDEALLETKVAPQMIKDYLVALRANKRQWSANTKERAEISYSNKKPHPQKGTGNARQGFLGSPQYKGGGIVFGPKPKFKQNIRINRKEKRAAIKALIIDLIKSDSVIVLEDVNFEAPRTKSVFNFLKSRSIDGKRTLFLKDEKNDFTNFCKSVRNLPKIECKRAIGVNGYDLALTRNLIVMQSAVDEFKSLIGERIS